MWLTFRRHLLWKFALKFQFNPKVQQLPTSESALSDLTCVSEEMASLVNNAVNNVVGSIIAEYFSIFFRNFKKEDFDFGTTTTLSNLG